MHISVNLKKIYCLLLIKNKVDMIIVFIDIYLIMNLMISIIRIKKILFKQNLLTILIL